MGEWDISRQKHAVVIGGGLSGLSAACYIARSGWQVTLLEKNPKLGGKIQHRYRDGFKFNLGPTMYLMPDVFEEFFNDFGLRIESQLKLSDVHPYIRVFDNGEISDLSDIANTKSLLEQKSKGSGRAFKKMMNRSRQLYANLRLNYFNINWLGLLKFNNLDQLLNISKLKLNKNYKTFMHNYITDKPTEAALSLPAAYLGSSPSLIPAVFASLPHLFLGQKMKTVEGGMEQIVSSLESLAHSLGVYIKTSSPVKKISTKFRQVDSVICQDGTVIECDAVVSAVDYQYAEKHLLEAENQSYSSGYWARKHYSPSMLIISTAVKAKLDNLKFHNIFVGESEKFFDCLEKEDECLEPTFYVHVSSRMEAGDAPAGCDNLVIQVLLPPIATDDLNYYNLVKENIYKKISSVSGIDIKKEIVFEEMRAHSYFEDSFNASHGSAHGLGAKLNQIGPFAPGIKSKAVEGLFYAGQDVATGSSMGLAINSGKVTAYALIGKKSGRGKFE